MAAYRVSITPATEKALRKLPREAQARTVRRLRELAQNPRGRGCMKMKDHADEYRTRVGDYRIRYLIKDDLLLVIVIQVAHRKDVYRPA